MLLISQEFCTFAPSMNLYNYEKNYTSYIIIGIGLITYYGSV